jgi:ATP-dependent helicase HrpB
VKLPLPVDPFLPAIGAALVRHRAAVVIAAPGAGKTTRVPPYLAAARRVIVLQPRRIAARALARRIASEQGWGIGEEVGWHVRFERRFGPSTRLLVATEGILTARLQADPLLSDFDVVVLDEFHERSLHADLALALVRQAAEARPELAIVVMSATLDAGPVAAFLGGCPVIEVPGRVHALDVAYAAGGDPAEAVIERARAAAGHVLCFLPGLAEIRRVEQAVRGRTGDARVLTLHGSMDAEAQDEALRPSDARKILLATNVAETSITVDGVTDVVDSGSHKIVRYDAERAFDRLVLERIPQDSADQRAGRAGRTGPGRVLRLWDARDRLRPQREPEIARVDLAAPLLEVLAWGGDPRRFEWFEAPPAERVEAALQLLERLGATRGGKLTPAGEALRRLPLHPRLGRLLLSAGGSSRAAAICARLADGDGLRGPAPATSSDLLVLADEIGRAAPPVRRAADELRDLARSLGGRGLPAAGGDEDTTLRRAVLAAYPDRVGQRRAAGSPSILLASGQGARLARESGVHDAEWLVAVDVGAGAAGQEPLVRLASGVERDWLEPTHRDVEHRVEGATVRAVERDWYGRLLLKERPVAVDAEAAAALRLQALRERGVGEAGERLLQRLRFADLPITRDELLASAAASFERLDQVDLGAVIPHGIGRDLERLAPEMVPLPSGRTARVDYRDDGTAAISVKLQELFGLAESPRLGPRGEPLLILLLAPNGRPVQTTRDLRGFWERTYPEVRRELRGRYPRHPWPEDPWTATPTARAKPRR